jgi:hypothetical protein
MTVTLTSWLDEHPAPAGLVITRADATADGPYRSGGARVQVAIALPPRLSGVALVGTVYFAIATISAAVHLNPVVIAEVALIAGGALFERAAARRRHRARIVVEGARATVSGRDGAHTLDLATISSCRVVDIAGRTKSLAHDHVVELVTDGPPIAAWRGSPEELAWIAELLGVAIANAGGRADR